MHVDEFIDRASPGDEPTSYARFFLHLARLPADQQTDFAKWTRRSSSSVRT